MAICCRGKCVLSHHEAGFQPCGGIPVDQALSDRLVDTGCGSGKLLLGLLLCTLFQRLTEAAQAGTQNSLSNPIDSRAFPRLIHSLQCGWMICHSFSCIQLSLRLTIVRIPVSSVNGQSLNDRWMRTYSMSAHGTFLIRRAAGVEHLGAQSQLLSGLFRGPCRTQRSQPVPRQVSFRCAGKSPHQAIQLPDSLSSHIHIQQRVCLL